MTTQDPNQPPYGQQPPPPSFEKQPSPSGYPAAPPAGEYQYGPPPGGYPAAPPPMAGPPAGPGTPGLVYDPASGVYLPPGVQLASVGRRIGAYFLAIPLVIVTLGIGYIIWGLILWGQGTSPALKVLGMRCWVPEKGEVAGFGRMALRDIIGRIVDGILSFITELISFIMFVSTAKRQSLHDLVGGTVVVHDPNKVLG